LPPPFPPGGEPHGLSSNKFILVGINDVYSDFYNKNKFYEKYRQKKQEK